MRSLYWILMVFAGTIGVGALLTGLDLWPKADVPYIGKVLFFALGALLLVAMLVMWHDASVPEKKAGE